MTDRNIVLTGFMGCGKSLTSNKLAETLKRVVISTDDLVVKKEGQSIEEIFERSGEECFRRIEKDVVKEISDQKGVIIDCGGGIVLDSENVVNLKKNGIIFYLSASPNSIYKNVKNLQHRPLLDVQNSEMKIAELLEERKPFYEKADIIIDADHRTIDQIVEDVLKELENE